MRFRCWPVAVVLFYVGCCSPRVIVVDASGDAIPGAEVRGIGLTVEGPAVKTDPLGRACLPSGTQEHQWLTVEKEGYRSVDVDARAEEPIRVVLEAGR